MKKFFWIPFLTLIIFLSACGNSATPAPLPSLTSEPASTTNDFSSSESVIASAKIMPSIHSNMAFIISAPVKGILVKEGDQVKAGDELIVLHTPDLELAIAEAEFAVQSAQSKLERANDPYKRVFSDGRVTYVSGYLEQKLQAKARLQAALASLDEAKAAFAQGLLLAPFNGTIVDISIEQNELSSPGKIVLIIADTFKMQIETTDLSERDIPRISIGQAVNVYIEALDMNVTGKVIRISPTSDIVGGDTVYPVTIELDEQPTGMLWGMSAEVEITTK